MVTKGGTKKKSKKSQVLLPLCGRRARTKNRATRGDLKSKWATEYRTNRTKGGRKRVKNSRREREEGTTIVRPRKNQKKNGKG